METIVLNNTEQKRLKGECSTSWHTCDVQKLLLSIIICDMTIEILSLGQKTSHSDDVSE